MDDQRTQLEKINQALKNNRVVATLVVIATIVVGLSTFTNAAKNLIELVRVDKRAEVNGAWRAEVEYDWPNAKYTENFALEGDGKELRGTASFLGVRRGIAEGKVKGETIEFVTRTQVMAGESSGDEVHRYRGKLVADTIEFEMQTEGGPSAHVPVKFSARRGPAVAASAGRP